MSYELKKPFSDNEKMDFIVKYNHNQGLNTVETEMYLFALGVNEIMGEKEIETEVPDYETVIEEYQEPVYITVEKKELDEDGNVIDTYFVDEIDHYETKTKEVQKQIGSHIEKIVIPYPVVNPDYEKELKKKERERINNLSLTRADVERAIYRAKGMDFEDLIARIETLKQVQGDRGVQGDSLDIDLKALKIELKANNFYRGNPYINQIGAILGFTETQLDEFFKTRDYEKLLCIEDENEKLPEVVAENATTDDKLSM